MEEIPADVMEAAREAFEGFRDMFYIGQNEQDKKVSASAGVEHVARAIMAERMRCAKIADDIGNLERGERAYTAEHIAREIRKNLQE